jgi:hypothetical protein
MFKRCNVLLAAALAVAVCCAANSAGRPKQDDASMPERAEGTFVQRKTLADVDVTIMSKGTFKFEKGRSFEWRTILPMPSTFVATPTNYTFVVNGQTTTRNLRSNVDKIAKIFEIKEVKAFVKSVKSTPEQGFPDKVTVEFKNGDRLEIEMKR